MPRNPNRMARPHDHLLAASAAHARLSDGQAHPGEATATGDGPAEPTKSQRRARAQRRNDEGKFA